MNANAGATLTLSISADAARTASALLLSLLNTISFPPAASMPLLQICPSGWAEDFDRLTTSNACGGAVSALAVRVAIGAAAWAGPGGASLPLCPQRRRITRGRRGGRNEGLPR